LQSLERKHHEKIRKNENIYLRRSAGQAHRENRNT
jgi:hypothetical protein